MIHRLVPLLAFALAVILLCLLTWQAKAQIPPAVARWLPPVERHALRIWGHDRHVARHGAQIEQESGGRPDVYSRAGACGLMQFMPPTWREQSQIMGEFGDCRSPELNISHGIGYTKRLHDMQQRTASGCELWRQALASFNWGIGSVRKAVRRHGANWLNRAPKETQGYMRILRRERDYLAAGWPGLPVCEG